LEYQRQLTALIEGKHVAEYSIGWRQRVRGNVNKSGLVGTERRPLAL